MGTKQKYVINIGIIGNSKTGKSSFINAIRSIPDDHHLAAEVGVTEKTSSPTSYGHPHNPRIRLWDLPGMGNTTFSTNLEEYCVNMYFEKYDLFLIMAATRFTENDRQLAKMIRSLGKRFLFVRTKIDCDILAEWRKQSFDPQSVLNEIREDCIKNLINLVAKENIYLISNYYTTQWDFSKLTQDILKFTNAY